nr:hypothetical protein [Tanacetum cinerariifolium]
SFAASFTVSLAVGSGPSVVDTGFVLVDVLLGFLTVGTWYVSLSSMELTTELQSGTKVCASGLKHVIDVIAVPSSMIALKQ